MKCAEIRELLPAYVEDRSENLSARRHLSRCAACSAELQDYEALRSGLAGLRSEHAEPPAELLASLMSIRQEGPAVQRMQTHVLRHRKAYAGGVAVAVVGAAGAALWRSRRSRPLAA